MFLVARINDDVVHEDGGVYPIAPAVVRFEIIEQIPPIAALGDYCSEHGPEDGLIIPTGLTVLSGSVNPIILLGDVAVCGGIVIPPPNRTVIYGTALGLSFSSSSLPDWAQDFING